MNEGRLSTIAEQLEQGRTVISYTKGTSMQPLLYEGRSFVVLKPLDGELKVGDLPIYHRPDGKYVIHRIIKITDSHIFTRGDNCLTYEKVPREWFIGLVVMVNRMGKEIGVTDRGYLLYVRIWSFLYPVRSVWYRLRIATGRMAGKVKDFRKKRRQGADR